MNIRDMKRQPVNKLACIYAGKQLYLFSYKMFEDVSMSFLSMSTMRVQLLIALCRDGRGGDWKKQEVISRLRLSLF